MSISAVTDKRGAFKQGDWGVVSIRITDNYSNPIDVESITISISKDSSIVSFDSYIPMQVDDGFYVFEWVIDSDQTTGEYLVTWAYEYEGETYTEEQSIVIFSGSSEASAPILYNERLIAIRDSLEHLITCAQKIPVYFEQAKPSRDRKLFEFSFPRWNQSNKIKIYRNKQVLSSGYNINYYKGGVLFDNRVLDQDIINADYEFRWFSDDEIDQFLNNSLQAFNSFPPYGNYTLNNVPTPYISAVLYGASKDALRHLMMCLQFQEPQQVFGGGENAQKAFSNIETLKQNYEKDWDKLTEIKKYGKYPGAKMIISPEFTLPGGKSRWFRLMFK